MNAAVEASRSCTSISGKLLDAVGSWKALSMSLAAEHIESLSEDIDMADAVVVKDGLNRIADDDLDNVKGMSVVMLDTDRRGVYPCADRPRLVPLLRRWEAGEGVTAKPGPNMDAGSEAGVCLRCIALRTGHLQDHPARISTLEPPSMVSMQLHSGV